MKVLRDTMATPTYECLHFILLQSHKSTVWSVRHLPQNRDVFMTTGGNGTLHLWK